MKRSRYDYLKKSPGSTIFSEIVSYGAWNGTSREKPQMESPGDERLPVQTLQDVTEGQDAILTFFHSMNKMEERPARKPTFDFRMNRQDMDSPFGKS